MDLDRGTLARIDRRLLAGLDRDKRFQMVRVPVTPAKWSTWKRYCDAAGISMGRAIAALIDHELADREAALTKRGNELSEAEERVRRWSEHLRGREHEIEVREWRVEAATNLPSRPAGARTKTGRNERCPCGSGLKHKQCHGLPGR